MHGDIGCNQPGELFRECTEDELVALGCPEDALLISSADFESSWLVAKMNGAEGECGVPMPASPGNTPASGWSEERRACLLEYFRSLTLPP